jgi:hypothetical protein
VVIKHGQITDVAIMLLDDNESLSAKQADAVANALGSVGASLNTQSDKFISSHIKGSPKEISDHRATGEFVGFDKYGLITTENGNKPVKDLYGEKIE